MFHSRIATRLRKVWGRRAPRQFGGVLQPVERMRQILDRERARADRTGDEFSLLWFLTGAGHNGSPREGEATLRQLIRVLRQRLRSTDEIGWLENRDVGVVLPSTPARGAWKVADDIRLCFPARRPVPECRVYTYPSDWRATGQGEAGTDVRLADADRTVHAMEPLFVQPMPLWKRVLDVLGASIGLVLLATAIVATLGWLVARNYSLTFGGITSNDNLFGGAVMLVVSTAILLWVYLQREPPVEPLCPTCEYNLTGNVSGVCPECGTPVPATLQGKIARTLGSAREENG